MKYQIRMIVEVNPSPNKDPATAFFNLEDWMVSLPVEYGDLIDFGLASTNLELLNKTDNWEK